MRPRKRTNWPIVVYRYWVEPEYTTWEQLPCPIQQEAEAMRTLWNQLVDAFVQRQASYYNSMTERLSEKLQHQVIAGVAKQSLPEKEIASSLTAPRNDTSPLTSQTVSERPSPLVLRQIQKAFLQTTQEVSKASPVTWANKQFVTTQFFAALTRFFSKQGNSPQPRAGEFQDLHFQHRFTEGGLPIERIFGHSQRLSLTNVPSDAFSQSLPQRHRKRLARTDGFFQISGQLVRFRTILHRPFPPGAYLKTAALVGKKVTQNSYHGNHIEGRSIPGQWDWSLQLTLEVPPLQLSLPEDRATAAVQVRCELIDRQRLCFAILTDASGREEALCLPDPLLESWQHKRALQRQADRLLERTKQQLQCLPPPAPLSLPLQQMFSHLTTAQAPGLWRLLHSLDEVGVANETVQILRQWAADSTKLLREARGLEQRYLGHRDWFYHNVALQLCRRYQQLVITATELRTLHTQTKEGEATTEHQERRTHHQLIAPSRFVSFVQQAANKTGTTVTVASGLHRGVAR